MKTNLLLHITDEHTEMKNVLKDENNGKEITQLKIGCNRN